MRCLALGDQRFPTLLASVRPPVERLWILGGDLPAMPSVAIVGARGATPYGLEVARGIATDLADAGICVVSGMARGIDAAAHEGALDAGGHTVAVLGSGVDVPFPRQNVALYRRILDAGGTVVSELDPGHPATRYTFPMRNRIIAGLSRATVLVQAGDRSGALGTVAATVRLERTVFAVPGDVRADVSRGPHALLRDGAYVCADASDVLAVLAFEEASRIGDVPAAPRWLAATQAAVLGALPEDGASPTQVAARAGLDPFDVAQALSHLEMLGLLRRTAAGVYIPTRPTVEERPPAPRP